MKSPRSTFLIYAVAPATLLLLLLGSGRCAVVSNTPLKCEQYSSQKCKSEGLCNVTLEKCESDSDKPSSCFVLWSNETGTTKIEMKGCFSNNVACDQTECVDQSAEQRNNLNFCCCQGDRCNSVHRWIPTTTVPTEVEVPQKNTIDIVGIIGLVVSAIVVVAIIGSVVYYIVKQKKPSRFDSLQPENEPTSSSPCLEKRQIELIEIKARGRFGTVWQGLMKAEEVAVKIFPMQDKESWQKEQDIYTLPRLKHPNILEFIGAEKQLDKTDFWIITAYHGNGSLCDYLKSHTITWNELCRIAESMARGLMHLHEEIGGLKGEGLKPAVAHRDFKSKNVLLKDDLTACIADFGLAMIFEPGKSCGDTHGQVGTRRYMAPEVLEGAINFTRDAFLRIDVYACGLVLWEMVSRCDGHGGQVPEYALPFEMELGLHPTLEQMQENVVMKKLRPRINEKWRTHPGLSAICDTMEECWDHDAEARLSSSCVMERVSQHNRYSTTPLLIEANTDTPYNVV